MIFRQACLEGIRNGAITIAFRRWKRPTVRTGGTLLTPIGQLAIRSVTPVALSEITRADSHNAGYSNRDDLIAELNARSDGEVYRIELGDVAADPRIALRSRSPDADEVWSVIERLERLDRRSPVGPWTMKTLRIIADHPGVRAVELARMLDQVREPFKVNVRKLKKLGLTESLEVGYRLSPRGQALLEQLPARIRPVG